MALKELIEISNLEYVLRNIYEWIRSVDQKISIFIVFQGITITVLSPQIYSLVLKKSQHVSFVYKVILIFSFLLFLSEIILLLISLMARLKNKTNSKSLIYFGDIPEVSLNDYQKSVFNLNREIYKEDLIRQCYISARIASLKYKLFNKSVILFIAGSFLIIVEFLLIHFKFI